MGVSSDYYKISRSLWEKFKTSNNPDELYEKEYKNLHKTPIAREYDGLARVFWDLRKEGKIKKLSPTELEIECDIDLLILDKDSFKDLLSKIKERSDDLIKSLFTHNNDEMKEYHIKRFLSISESNDPDSLVSTGNYFGTSFDAWLNFLFIYKTLDWDNYVIFVSIG